MIVDLVRMDAPKARLARGIPGAFADYAANMWKLNTAANENGVAVAMELFPERHAELEAALGDPETVADTRPLDMATPWAGDRPAAVLLPNLASDPLIDMLYRYQVVDVAFGVARLNQDGGMYYGHDRGLGKTLLALVTWYEMMLRHMIVVCPNSAKEPVWMAEANKWFPWMNCYVVGNTATQRDRAYKTWKQQGGLLIIHYEALRLIDWKDTPKETLVVVDEAHRLSNGNAGPRAPKFYKALKKIPANYRLALSGSVLINSPEDIFGAIHWLFPKRYASKERDWNARYVRYAEGSAFKVCIGVKPEKLADMRAELGTFLIVRRKEDELEDLPELITQTLEVELGPEQRRVYDEMAKTFVATLPEGDVITAGNVGAQLAKLRQIACGLSLVGPDTDELMVTDSVKLDLAIDLVMDNLPNKTVVFTWHRAAADAMFDRLTHKGVNAVVVHGGVPQKVRDVNINEFKTDPDCHVLVATIATVGESQNFQVANQVVFVEHSWTDVAMKQARDRVYRNGQKQRVTVVDLVAKRTIDTQRILPKLASKEALSKMILGG